MATNDSAHLSDVISSLERLAADVEGAASTSPDEVDRTLDAAAEAATRLIRDALPVGEDQSEWLSELSKATTAAPSLECACPVKRMPSTAEGLVRCIHSCDMYFCSARCRKRRLAQHRPTCQALRRKKVLKSIGLPTTSELF